MFLRIIITTVNSTNVSYYQELRIFLVSLTTTRTVVSSGTYTVLTVTVLTVDSSSCSCSVTLMQWLISTAFSRLGQLSVGGLAHVLSQLQQNRLHGVASFPMVEARQVARDHHATLLVDTGNVDFRNELDGGGLVRVVGATFECQRVDAVLVGRVRRSEDGAIPESHLNIVGIGQSKRAGFGSDSFFTVVELLQESK